MANILFTASLALFILAPARAGHAAGPVKSFDAPFDISSAVNPDGKLAVGFSVPVSLLNQLAADACVGGGMKLVDPSAPVVTSEGGDLIISNIENDIGRPYIVLTPFSSGRNTIGFAVKTLTVNGSLMFKFAQLLGLTEEKAFDLVMKRLEQEFTKGLPGALASEVPTPQQLLWFSHDAPSKTVYLSMANAFALPAMPRMEFDSVALADGVISLSLSSAESAAEVAAKGYVFALDARSLSAFMAKVINRRNEDGKTLQAIRYVRPGAPGLNLMTISGFTVVNKLPMVGGPMDVSYNAVAYVYMRADNFLCLEIRKVDITWMGNENVESYLSGPASALASLGVAQRAIIEQAVDSIVESSTMNEMAEVTKLNASTIGFKIKRGAVLPALSRYVDITGVRLEDNKAYLSYSMNF